MTAYPGQSSGVPKNRSQISHPAGQGVLFQNILGVPAPGFQLPDPLAEKPDGVVVFTCQFDQEHGRPPPHWAVFSVKYPLRELSRDRWLASLPCKASMTRSSAVSRQIRWWMTTLSVCPGRGRRELAC